MTKGSVFQTKRLQFSACTMEDYDWFLSLYQKPSVMRYIYDGSLIGAKETQEKLQSYVEEWEVNRFGLWVLRDLEGSQVGYMGFRYFKPWIEKEEPMRNIEFGYIFDEPFLRKGYGSEAAVEVVKRGVEQFGFKRILATVLPQNMGSIKLLKKAGLTFSQKLEVSGLEHDLYTLEID